ncbi:branched-chain amino acid transport system II carrier protein [Priestia aryabhattai]|uniref:branched-chain amino acid transport system II carrier protein n=1 Tax=Priestia megaterium TaxID=1404 RepID=UPI0039B8ED2C
MKDARPLLHFFGTTYYHTIPCYFFKLGFALVIITSIDDLFKNYLPLYNQGVGWLIPTVAAAFIGYIISVERGFH